MSEENEEVLDAVVQDDVSTDSDNNDTLNETAEADKYESQKARAEKAEAKVKELKEALENKKETSTPKKEDTQTLQTGLSREEAILFAKGLTEDEVVKASKIASIEGISLTDATYSDFFKAWQVSNEEKAKSEKAGLGASTGSTKVKERKDLGTPGLTREDHKALFDRKNK